MRALHEPIHRQPAGTGSPVHRASARQRGTGLAPWATFAQHRDLPPPTGISMEALPL
jgi:hypothetical protein